MPEHGLTIASASASTWAGPGLAVIRLFVVADEGHVFGPSEWEAMGEDLRAAVGRGEHREVLFVPASPVEVTATSQESGRSLVMLQAPNQPGLLWAVASWFERQGVNIEVVKLDAAEKTASATFVVVCPELDAGALAAAVGGHPVHSLPARFARLVARSVVAVFGIGAAVAVRSLRSARRK